MELPVKTPKDHLRELHRRLDQIDKDHREAVKKFQENPEGSEPPQESPGRERERADILVAMERTHQAIADEEVAAGE